MSTKWKKNVSGVNLWTHKIFSTSSEWDIKKNTAARPLLNILYISLFFSSVVTESLSRRLKVGHRCLVITSQFAFLYFFQSVRSFQLTAHLMSFPTYAFIRAHGVVRVVICHNNHAHVVEMHFCYLGTCELNHLLIMNSISLVMDSKMMSDQATKIFFQKELLCRLMQRHGKMWEQNTMRQSLGWNKHELLCLWFSDVFFFHPCHCHRN